jgi:hypothetical protein
LGTEVVRILGVAVRDGFFNCGCCMMERGVFTTIFNIHHISHYTTLIATHPSYYYYDSLNYPTPPLVKHIHSTLKEWYKDLFTHTHSPHNPTPASHHQKNPTSNRWLELWHTYASNQPRNYLPGEPPTLRLSQTQAEQLSRIELRCTLTGELNPLTTHLVTEHRKLNTAHPWATCPGHSPPRYTTHSLPG